MQQTVKHSAEASAVAAKAAEAGGSLEEAERKVKEKIKKAPKEKTPAVAQGKEDGLGLSVKKEENFGEWYFELVVKGEMIDDDAVTGCYSLRPWSSSIWDSIMDFLDREMKKLGVKNSYFPLFVTEEALSKEKNHWEGFAAEVAWVTKSGETNLEKPIAIRPTSETVMSREFVWQEGHTAYSTKEGADKEVMAVLDLYRKVYEDLLAVPVIPGIKSEVEKFAGGLYSTTIEAFIPTTGRGIEATSHCLGQNFAKIFDIVYEDEKGERQEVWQNSWGLTTRSIGVAVMIHGDDKGLVLPPRVSPVQVVVIHVPFKDTDSSALVAACKETHHQLKQAGIRVEEDTRTDYAPEWKYNHWELKAVPVRLELGPRDLLNKQVRAVRRDTGAKVDFPLKGLADKIKELLDDIQRNLFTRAKAEMDKCIRRASTWEKFMLALDNKQMVLAPWCDEKDVEEDVKLRTKTLCMPLEQPDLPDGTLCFASGKAAKKWALWGRSY